MVVMATLEIHCIFSVTGFDFKTKQSFELFDQLSSLFL